MTARNSTAHALPPADVEAEVAEFRKQLAVVMLEFRAPLALLEIAIELKRIRALLERKDKEL